MVLSCSSASSGPKEKGVEILAALWTAEAASKGNSIFAKPDESEKPKGGKAEGKKTPSAKKDGGKPGARKASNGGKDGAMTKGDKADNGKNVAVGSGVGKAAAETAEVKSSNEDLPVDG